MAEKQASNSNSDKLKNAKMAISVVVVLLVVISGWYFWTVHNRKPPIPGMDFDSFQSALAQRIQTKFNVAPGSVVVADVPYDVGTLLDPIQAYPSDDSDCLPKPVPQVRDALNLFPSYQLSSQTAAQITLGSNALQSVTSAGLDLTHTNSLKYSIDDVSVQLMDMKTLGQLTTAGECGTYVAGHPGVRLIRGVVMGRISFTMNANNPGSVQAQLKNLGGGSISTNADSSSVTVADQKSTQILQMLAVIEAPPQTVQPDRNPASVGSDHGHYHQAHPGPAPAAPPVKVPAPIIREAQTAQVAPPSIGNFVARVYLQQDAADPPAFGTKFAQALKDNWPKAQVIQQVEKIPSAKMPSGAQVRFFNAADLDIANKCRDHLKSIGIDARVVRVGLTAPQGQLEVWLPKAGTTPATS